MKGNKYNSVQIGKRLKKEAQERGLTTKDVANLIDYASEKSISYIYSGSRPITEDRIEKLSKVWGLRKEYLLCIDDWKTDKDIEFNAEMDDIKAFNTCKEYLKSLSLDLRPFIEIRCDLSTIYKKIDYLSEYITQESLSNLHSKYDFSLDYKSFMEKYDSLEDDFPRNYEPIYLKKPFKEMNIKRFRLDKYSAIGKDTNVPTSQEIALRNEQTNTKIGSSLIRFVNGDSFIEVDKSSLDESYVYHLGYHIYYQNEYKCDCNVCFLQEFMKRLDSFARCAIDTLMISEGKRRMREYSKDKESPQIWIPIKHN